MTIIGIRLFEIKSSLDLLTSHTPFTVAVSQPPLKTINTKAHKKRKVAIPNQQDRDKITEISIFLIFFSFSFIIFLVFYKIKFINYHLEKIQRTLALLFHLGQ